MDVPHWRRSAGDLARAIRDKTFSSREVIRAHLERIDAVNPKVNALTVVLRNEALRAAGKADERLASGEPAGPLHGVPFTVKENFDVVGSATTHGVVDLKDSMPQQNCHVVALLKGAGAIPIGRSNMPDFGMRWHTTNDLHGPTLNPWDPSRTPGGSSGGEAAAIATGMSPLGIGGDMGGSLRYPAQCCGIAAIKPTLGRVSRIATAIFTDPPMFYEQAACVSGPMARHVGDLRLALSVMARRDPADPLWTAPPAPDSNKEPRSVRVALSLDPWGEGASAAVADGVKRAANILADGGYDVEEADPPSIAEGLRILEQIANTETKSYLPTMLGMMSREAQIILERIVEDTVPDLSAYTQAIAARYRIAREWNLFMEKYPLILSPVSALQPFEVGTDLAGKDELRRLVRAFGLTELCNLLGLPSVAVPIQVEDGVPQGVQLIGSRFQEDLCLDAAEVIEGVAGVAGVLTPIDPRETPTGS
jgi:amidase